MIKQKVFTKCRFVVRILILLFVCIGFSKIVQAQDEVVRVDTNLVTIPTTVLDREGRYVTNLKKENFQIFEDGVEQDINFFEPVEQKCTALLLLDVSGSMYSHFSELANASSVFVKQLRPDDELIAVAFAEELRVLLKPTKIRNLQTGIKLPSLRDYHDTVVYDAVEFALKKMRKIPGRKAIILFSDGIGSGISASAKSNLRDAEEQESQIYTVQFAFSPIAPEYIDKKQADKWIETANNYMQSLAQKTGGRHYRIEDIADLGKTFSMIADELGRQYNLGYYPKQSSQKGERKQIKVRVNLPNLAVRSRDSYVVGNSRK